MIVHRHPIQWYADKIDRGEPFSLLTYGDGEFMVASGQHVGSKISGYREVCTPKLTEEMRASFAAQEGSEIVRGSDPNIIDPEQYMGRDRDMMWGVHRKAGPWIAMCEEWVDGVVWDVAVREGNLGPFLKALRRREVALIGSPAVACSGAVGQRWTVEVPANDAAGAIDRVAANAAPNLTPGMVVVVCVGLSAIPLIMRLRKACPSATFLDLGSTFDVFARTGAERGWRGGMYQNQQMWEECVRKNLEGL